MRSPGMRRRFSRVSCQYGICYVVILPLSREPFYFDDSDLIKKLSKSGFIEYLVDTFDSHAHQRHERACIRLDHMENNSEMLLQVLGTSNRSCGEAVYLGILFRFLVDSCPSNC